MRKRGVLASWRKVYYGKSGFRCVNGRSTDSPNSMMSAENSESVDTADIIRLALATLSICHDTTMISTRIFSALLVVVLSTSASGCVLGWASQPTYCLSSANQSCTSRSLRTTIRRSPGCGLALKARPAGCSLRSFLKFQFVAFDRFEISTPLRCIPGKVSALPDSAMIVSSIGSPQTDRGPPRS